MGIDNSVGIACYTDLKKRFLLYRGCSTLIQLKCFIQAYYKRAKAGLLTLPMKKRQIHHVLFLSSHLILITVWPTPKTMHITTDGATVNALTVVC